MQSNPSAKFLVLFGSLLRSFSFYIENFSQQRPIQSFKEPLREHREYFQLLRFLTYRIGIIRPLSKRSTASAML